MKTRLTLFVSFVSGVSTLGLAVGVLVLGSGTSCAPSGFAAACVMISASPVLGDSELMPMPGLTLWKESLKAATLS